MQLLELLEVVNWSRCQWKGMYLQVQNLRHCRGTGKVLLTKIIELVDCYWLLSIL